MLLIDRLQSRSTTKEYHIFEAFAKRSKPSISSSRIRGEPSSPKRTTPTRLKQENAESRPSTRISGPPHRNTTCCPIRTDRAPHLLEPLPAVVESLTSPTTTPSGPAFSHLPVLQPYNAGRDGIGWVPERAGVECISLRLGLCVTSGAHDTVIVVCLSCCTALHRTAARLSVQGPAH